MKSLAEQMSTICEKTFLIFNDFDYYELLEAHKDDETLAAAIRDLEEKKELHFLHFLSDLMLAQDDYYEKSTRVYTNLRKKIEFLDKYLSETYTERPAHEGIVYTKGGDKYMMVLKGDTLRRFKERDLSEPPMDVITCSLRVPLAAAEEDVPGRFKFELLSPKILRPITLYTDTEAERTEWSRAIQSAITRNISNVTSSATSPMASSLQRSGSPPAFAENGGGSMPSLSGGAGSQSHLKAAPASDNSARMLRRSQSVAVNPRAKRLPGQSPLQPQPLGHSPPSLVSPTPPKRRPAGPVAPRSHSQDPPDCGDGAGGRGAPGSAGAAGGAAAAAGDGGIAPRGGATLSEEELGVIRSIPGNEVCAECGAKDPEWAVINQGILICLECSGVHRSLGTHVSKVRSLLLDKWLPETLLLFKNIGNSNSKAIFEHKIEGLTNVKRLYPTSDRPSREEFIKNKYVKKLFIDDSDFKMTSRDDVNKSLFATVSRRNGENVALSLVKLLANGADPNFSNTAEEAKTPLFQTLVRGNLLNLEILLLNGADVTVPEERGWLPFHYAAFYNRPRCLRRLIETTKGKIPHAKGTPLTPFDVAVWNHSVECIRLLRGAPEQAVEFTFDDVLNSHNSHEDVFTIPQRTLVPPKEMCSKIPKVRVPGCQLSKSTAGLPAMSPPASLSASPPAVMQKSQMSQNLNNSNNNISSSMNENAVNSSGGGGGGGNGGVAPRNLPPIPKQK